MALIVIGGAAGIAAAWVVAVGAPGPVLEFEEPAAVGRLGELVLAIETPGGKLSALDVVLEQEGQTLQVFSLAGGDAGLTEEGEDRLVLRQPIGRERFEALREGDAMLIATAARPVLLGWREAATRAEHSIEVRLRPPTLGVQSQFHYVNHGGSELVVYRVNPPDVVTSGVRVGDVEYPGFPAAGAGVEGAEPSLHVAFFALLWNQPRDTPITVFARDRLGNEGTTTFDYRILAKQFRESSITVSDDFLSRVVPAILQNTPELRVEDPTDHLAAYLRINGDLRRENDAYIRSLAEQTAPEILWKGPFKQLINTAVESGFADQREYVYDGEVVDHQTHLGFDLASTAAAPVLAANHGRVVHAGWLGIYGNCVILDHGMGLQSLYAHLSQIDVAPGERVTLDQRLGRSGATGLAAGDHLHFTMLLNGHAVTPVDWWSSQWVEDRILRKLREAGTRRSRLSARQ